MAVLHENYGTMGCILFFSELKFKGRIALVKKEIYADIFPSLSEVPNVQTIQ